MTKIHNPLIASRTQSVRSMLTSSFFARSTSTEVVRPPAQKSRDSSKFLPAVAERAKSKPLVNPACFSAYDAAIVLAGPLPFRDLVLKPVKTMMVSCRHHLQILKPIIRSVVVNVMNYLSHWDRPVGSFPHHSMLKCGFPPTNRNEDITALWVNASSALPPRGVFSPVVNRPALVAQAAEIVGAFRKYPGIDWSSALTTGFGVQLPIHPTIIQRMV